MLFALFWLETKQHFITKAFLLNLFCVIKVIEINIWIYYYSHNRSWFNICTQIALIPSSYVKGAKRNSRCVADSKVAYGHKNYVFVILEKK